MPTTTFEYAREEPWSRVLPPPFRRPPHAQITCSETGLEARYGPFVVATPWSNVRDASVTGPYRWFRAIGPRLSLTDRGVTFGTAAAAGACIRFHEPVAALFGPLRVHPGLTVTVADPGALVAEIAARTTG